MFLTFTILICCFLSSKNFINCSHNSTKPTHSLRMVNVLFRHGNRTPIKEGIFPTDEHFNETYYPFGPDGQLTNIGKQNSYKLGLFIRERYVNYLKDMYYIEDVEAISSDTPRTQMTLQAVLAGLYAPVYPNYLEPYLMWQPISYKTQRFEFEDDIFGFCPLDPIERPLDSGTKTLYDHLTKYSGWNVTSSDQVEKIYDTILVESQMGFDIPDWATNIWPDVLANASVQKWVDINNYHLPKAVGYLIRKITRDFLQKTECSFCADKKQLVLYSGHDGNVAALLGAFGAYDNQLLSYNACLFVELHEIEKMFGIKVFFKNGPEAEVQPIKIKGCEEFCKIDDFIKITRHLYIPEPICKASK